jgi:hypothetical protein
MRLASFIALAVLVVPGTICVADAPPKPELLESRKIWDAAPHNAFTDLIRFKDAWYCCFREGAAHVSPDGAVRIITSTDGQKWTSAARLARDGADLRDAKLTITPDGQLMLNTVAAFPAGSPVRHRSMVWFSADGKEWGEGKEIGEPNFWIWRVAWRDKTAYAVGYGTAGPKVARLYSSADGIDYKPLVETLHDQGEPNEAGLTFLPDGTLLCLLRRDEGKATALLGRSKPPYKGWTWKDLGQRIGGPAMIRLPDGRLVAGVRLLDKRARTSLCWVDPDAGKLTEFLTLPSGGDTSYPGLVMHEGVLWVSYYSSHEGKTCIYLAKVRLPPR